MISFTNSTPKIAIFRALQLGDLLCAVPAFRALRQAYPTAEITLLGLPWAESFVKRFPHYLDRFVHFPGYHGLPEQSFSEDAWQDFQRRMRMENFDLILQMQGKGTIVNTMLQTLGAKQLAGFHCDEAYMHYPFFLEYPTMGSEVERHMQLMRHLALPASDNKLEYPVEENERAEYQLLKEGFPHPFVCVHPGSRGSWRQWPPEHFASLADHVANQGYTIVLTGTKEEALITSAVKTAMQQEAIDLTGKTSLGAIALLIQHASMLISNCTGVSHIAAAVETPSIVISMDGEPERWGPINKTLHKTVDWIKTPDYQSVVDQTMQLLQELTKKTVA